MLKLRLYQQTGVDEIRESYINKNVAPLFVLPTGGGKTVVFCKIAEMTSKNNRRVLILVHRVELLRQTSKALNKSGVEHGLIHPDYTPDRNALVQVASVQTLVRRLDKIDAPDLIIIDESHHAVAGSWLKVKNHFDKAKILGVTATPIRGDGKGLDSVFDDLILGPQISDLIEMGFLVKPIVYAPKTKIDFSSVKIVRGDYDREQVTELMDKPTITGDAVQHYKKLCSGVPAVAFCVSINHAKHVAEEFRAHGYRAFAVSGDMSDDERTNILNGLGDGRVDVVTSCDLISEGTDIPAIGCAIFLRPTKSTGLYIQQGGRALRLSEGKTQAIILDHVGNVFNHGFLDEKREWSLEGKKKRSKRNAEPSISVKQCEECFAVHEPAPSCPYCGFVYKAQERELEQVDGELVAVTEIDKKAIQKKRRMEVGRARTLPELLEIEKKRGYKSGWAIYMHRIRNNKKK